MQLLCAIMTQGEHRLLLCSTQQYPVGYDALKDEFEDSMKKWEVQTAEQNSGKKVFVAEHLYLQYTRGLETNTKILRSRELATVACITRPYFSAGLVYPKITCLVRLSLGA